MAYVGPTATIPVRLGAWGIARVTPTLGAGPTPPGRNVESFTTMRYEASALRSRGTNAAPVAFGYVTPPNVRDSVRRYPDPATPVNVTSAPFTHFPVPLS